MIQYPADHLGRATALGSKGNVDLLIGVAETSKCRIHRASDDFANLAKSIQLSTGNEVRIDRRNPLEVGKLGVAVEHKPELVDFAGAIAVYQHITPYGAMGLSHARQAIVTTEHVVDRRTVLSRYSEH